MVKLLEYLILKARKKEYKIEEGLGSYQLFVVVKDRLLQLLRAWICYPFVTKGRILFFGRGVTLRHRNKIKFGSGVVIDDFVRINALGLKGITLGNNVTIASRCELLCTGVVRNIGIGIVIGEGSAFNVGCFLAGQGGIEIGKSVIVGPYVQIFSENHNYDDLDTEIVDQGESRRGVVIGDNCWIGASVVILDGVSIGSGCVISAGAVVTKSFPENSVIGGVPAKIIKKRIEK